MFKRAESRLLDRKYADAISSARDVLSSESDHADAAAVVIYAYFAQAKFDKARAILASFTAQPSTRRSVRFQLVAGAVHEQAGSLTDALTAYRAATTIKPDLLVAWNRRALVELRLAQEAQAIASLETALSLDRDSVVVLTNLGTAYRRRAEQLGRDNKPFAEQLKRAEKAYRTVIALRAGYAPAYFNLALMLFESAKLPGMSLVERMRQAEQYFRQYKRLGDPGNAASASIDDYISAAQKAGKVATPVKP